LQHARYKTALKSFALVSVAFPAASWWKYCLGNGEKSARMTCLFPVVRKLAKKVYCNLRTKAPFSNYNRPFSNGMRIPFFSCALKIFALCAENFSAMRNQRFR
jgi:hypothetical protein